MSHAWRWMAARAAGSSHVAACLPCQDRYAVSTPRPGRWIAALADGAGSAPLGDRGAEAAVDAAVRSLAWAGVAGGGDPVAAVRAAAAEARAGVVVLADAEGVEPRQAACTLLVVTMGPEGGAALQIGDGLIAVSEGPPAGEGEGAGEWSWVFWPQRGEFANTTFFLSDPDAEERWVADSLPPSVTDVALLSDGLEALALHYASLSAHGPFFDAFLAPLARAGGEGEVTELGDALGRFLVSERVTERTDDDVSLVLATRRPPVGAER